MSKTDLRTRPVFHHTRESIDARLTMSTTRYAKAIRDELPDAVAVLDAFHVVKLGTQVVDEVGRRVQQDTLGRRGHRDDPLYKIRGLLRRGREHLSAKAAAKLNACLIAGGPG